MREELGREQSSLWGGAVNVLSPHPARRMPPSVSSTDSSSAFASGSLGGVDSHAFGAILEALQ